MYEKIRHLLRGILAFLRMDTEDRELLQTVARRVMGTTLAVYIAWHIISTLGWPNTFSPSIYLISILMVMISLAAFKLLEKFYLLAQFLWYLGLGTSIVLAFYFYRRPEVLFIFILLPIMAEVMIGIRFTLIMESVIILMALFWNQASFLPALPDGYTTALILSTLVATVLGWGISYNLIASIETASLHYREARKRLNETREQRAEISVLLKDVNSANYQLDRMNLMLTHARSQADKAREERDRFALAVSHELRSPLNFIIGFSDLMVNSPETYGNPEEWPVGLYDDIKEIYKSSTHLMQLINDILDMGKMDARQFSVFREKIDFASIAEDVHEMVHMSITNKGLEFHIVIEPDLPPVFVDRTRIRQVLLNLVTNALRFTRQGSITIKAFRYSPELLRVEVIDTGMGIAKEDLNKVFHEFKQVGEEQQRSGEGSGLGLSIGRRLIRMHNGEMGVESEKGKGSVFYFTVPFHQQIDDVHVISNENSFLSASIDLQNKPEKEPLILFLTADAFSAQVFAKNIKGYKVTLLTDPLQLASMVQHTFPRAVIIDEHLVANPAIQAFEENPPYDIPVITFPLPMSLLNRTSNLPLGVKNYLVKPVPRQVLLDTVENLNLTTRTILIVDDDPSMSRYVMQALRTGSDDDALTADEFKFLTALDGQEALRFLHTIPVGVVFLDLDLTDMHGLTLLNQMQQNERFSHIPVVIISASDPPSAFNPHTKSLYSVLVNRQFEDTELSEMIRLTLQQISPVYDGTKTGISSGKINLEVSQTQE